MRPTRATRTALCTAAVTLISAATATLVYGMQGGDLDATRWAATAAGILLGGGLVHVGHCAEAWAADPITGD